MLSETEIRNALKDCFDPEVKLKPEELARLAGSWVAKEGYKNRTEVVGGYLRLVFPTGDPMLLAATSPTSFRPRTGEPGRKLTFTLQGGRAVSMTLVEPDATTVFTREGKQDR